MFFSAKVDGKLAMRAYTPTSSDHDKGIFDLVIKVWQHTYSAQPVKYPLNIPLQHTVLIFLSIPSPPQPLPLPPPSSPPSSLFL